MYVTTGTCNQCRENRSAACCIASSHYQSNKPTPPTCFHLHILINQWHYRQGPIYTVIGVGPKSIQIEIQQIILWSDKQSMALVSHLSCFGHSIHLNLPSSTDELGDDNWMLLEGRQVRIQRINAWTQVNNNNLSFVIIRFCLLIVTRMGKITPKGWFGCVKIN